jgi:uncharacterized protein (DUF486 family)
MHPIGLSIHLPTFSNVFMTFAWYAHLAALCILGAVYFVFRSKVGAA